MPASELHPDLGTVDVILKHNKESRRPSNREHARVAPLPAYLRAADFRDDLPGLVEDRQSLGFWRVGTRQTATQRSEQQMLEGRTTVVIF